jgi:hypothetical protein
MAFPRSCFPVFKRVPNSCGAAAARREEAMFCFGRFTRRIVQAAALGIAQKADDGSLDQNITI